MALRLGDEAPNFQAETTEGDIDFHQWIGDNWAILFSHPADYTPVCTTELGYTAKLQPEFQKRGVKTIAVSVDSLEDHHGWINDINETQNTTVNFPIIADSDRAVATAPSGVVAGTNSAGRFPRTNSGPEDARPSLDGSGSSGSRKPHHAGNS